MGSAPQSPTKRPPTVTGPSGSRLAGRLGAALGGAGEGGAEEMEKNPIIRRLKKLKHKVLFGKVGEKAYAR